MTFEQIRAHLSLKRVGIAGCGGLGSNCAMALARVGVGTLVIVDFDMVEETNLNRQYYFFDQIGMKKVDALAVNLKRACPTVVTEAHALKVVPDNVARLFGSCDVIVEAFDRASEKQMLIETVTAVMPGKPLVVGNGMAGFGKSDQIRLRRTGNLWICGDGVSEVSPELPPLAPRVGMVAMMQANVVVEGLMELGVGS
jgi:sulfur carrier protein ThiS adenylyltransferase